ncbi:hypothetical protein [Rhizobium sullae]|uniref:hypothetical protein n=1 Tax=Rhizobium sullae TaxID=50338 RepID=UPI00315CCC56
MRIVWDKPKGLANIDKHALDFADLDSGFFLTAVLRRAKRGRIMATRRFAMGRLPRSLQNWASKAYQSFQ